MTLSWTSLLVTLASVAATDPAPPRPFHFENDITPILTRYQCNTSGCHGGAEGQNGFKLSVFGFDAPADYAALVKEARGRRVQFSAVDNSLLLRKASGSMPHGGGSRIRVGSKEYEMLRGWLRAGAPFGDPAAPRVVKLSVEPTERVMAMNATQPLRVTARFSDGYETDVTGWAKFQTNNDSVAAVNDDGLVTAGTVPGEVAVMASYLNNVVAFRAIVPRTGKVAFPTLDESNPVDKHVNARLRKLNLLPSPPADDATFLRRVYLDVIGTLPTLAETKSFLADKRTDRRTKLIDQLLERPEYADAQALVWADILRIDRESLGPKRAQAYQRWLTRSFAANKPFDRFVRELVLAEGSLDEVAPANFYKAIAKPNEMASAIAQNFLGIRIACAQCHHHPYDRWSQDDYFGMVGFFAPLSLRKTDRGEVLEAVGDPVTKNPRTTLSVYAHALATPMPDADPAGDRRTPFAEWLTADANPWFAKNLANRLWAHYFGRGIVEPVDDLRATNPPTNPELLEALTREVKTLRYDMKKFVRLLMTSQAYQRSSRPLPENESDETNFSRALFRRIPAEVLLDAVSQATGVDERFPQMPPGGRAVQLWDNKTQHYFLKLFGRPQRLSSCSCERNIEPSVAQVLHLFNSPEIQQKLAHDRGTVAKLVARRPNDADLVDDLYMTFLSRSPSSRERDISVSHLANHANERRQAAEDLAWSLLNSLEFVFNH